VDGKFFILRHADDYLKENTTTRFAKYFVAVRGPLLITALRTIV
jgi:hypothetical protein